MKMTLSIRDLKSAIRNGLAIVAVSSIPAIGQAATDDAVPSLPPQAKVVEGILVPVPSEVFRSLDEFHEANWLKVQRQEVHRWKSRGDQVQIALLLGTVVAEGFIAMEAEDSAEVKKVGTKVLALARALGVEHSVLRRSGSIVDYADKGEWAAARKEWDGALSDLEEQMIAIDSQPLLQLVSLGGWLRGTEALCGLVGQDYSAAHSKMIRQPAMLDYLEKQLVGMRGKMRNHSVVVKMLEGLRKIRSLIEEESGDLSKQTVRDVGKTCSELVTVFSHRPT
jgi:hypothetical protein